MPEAVLATKLFFPRSRPELVPRPLLVERLDEGLRLGHRLILVSAPAGYGKTTLVSAWLQTLAASSSPEGQKRAAWLSLDEADNDPFRFFTYLVAALQLLDERVGQEAQALLALPQLPAVTTLMAALVNDIAAAHGPFILVLDDYHTIRTPAIHDAVDFLLEYQPPDMHLAIITRADPPLPMSRLRGRGQLTEVRVDDLRFSAQEAAVFFQQTMKLDLDAGAINVLERRTEGWVAGLQLAALSLRGRDGPRMAEFVASFSGSHRYVIDYLLDEVMQRQPEEVRTFLAQTAVLDRLSAPLCNAVTGRDDSQAILAELEMANLFLIPLDDRREWYRYHHLFAETLRVGLDEAQAGEIHRRAAGWFQENGFLQAAIQHALAGRHFELAADLIERAGQEVNTWNSGNFIALFGHWLAVLPETVVKVRPRLRLYAVRALYLSGQAGRAEQAINEVAQLLASDTARQMPDFQGFVAAYQTAIEVRQGQVSPAWERTGHVIANFFPAQAQDYARALFTFGTVQSLKAEGVAAEVLYNQCSQVAQAAGARFLAISALERAGRAQLLQGRLQLAIQTCQRALDMARSEETGRLAISGAWMTLTMAYYYRHELPTAMEAVQAGLAAARQGHNALHEIWGGVLLIHLQQAGGESEAAEETASRVWQAIEPLGDPFMVKWAAIRLARFWLREGQVERALSVLQADPQPSVLAILAELENMTLARLLLAQNRPAEALARLETLQAAAQAAGRGEPLLEILLLRVLALARLNDLTAARTVLQQVVALAAPERFVRPFLDEGPFLAGLLPQVRAAAPAFVDEVLQAVAAGPQPAQASDVSVPAMVEPLSGREMEILRLVSQGFSNADIARTLFITPGTTKWHMTNIYAKLGVRSRTQAIHRALELGLF